MIDRNLRSDAEYRANARAALRHMRCEMPAQADGRFSCLCGAGCFPLLSNRRAAWLAASQYQAGALA